MKIKCDLCSYTNYEWSVRYHQKKHENSHQARIVDEIFEPDNLMPKITSVAGNVVKIVDDSIIAAIPSNDSESPLAKKRKIVNSSDEGTKECPLCRWKRYYLIPDLKKHCYTTHRSEQNWL